MRNGEGYSDPTAGKAMSRIRKTRVMNEAAIERADQLRPHVPTIDGWSEAEEQEHLIKWCELSKGKHPCLFRILHIPNGGSRHPAEAVHLKRMGVKPGVPDLLLPYPAGGYHGLWIEMKSKIGKPSALQKDWIEWLRSVGYAAWVCMGMEAAQECVLRYLDGTMEKGEGLIWGRY